MPVRKTDWQSGDVEEGDAISEGRRENENNKNASLFLVLMSRMFNGIMKDEEIFSRSKIEKASQ